MSDYKTFLLTASLESSDSDDSDYFQSQESYSSNGQVQSSSDSGKAHKSDPGLPGIGFNLTDDGNFDLDGKRLTDVADPIDNGDAATKGYVDTKNSTGY